MSDQKVNLWGQYDPEQVAEMRLLAEVQARFPGLVAEQLGDVRQALGFVPNVPPEMFEQIDIILKNCRAAHENSRLLWALLGTAQLLPAKEEAH